MEERAGCIIPILRHTRAMRHNIRFSEELVTQRMVYLSTFLTNVMRHPDLVDSPALQTFLTADFTTWETAKKSSGIVMDDLTLSSNPDDVLGDTPVSDSSTNNSSGSGRISYWMSKVRTKIALAAPNVNLESTPDDNIFNDAEAYIENLDKNIKSLHKGAENLVKILEQSSETMKEMSLSFAEMGEYKLANDVTVRSPSYSMHRKLGVNWNNLSKLGGFQQASTTMKLEEPLEEMCRDVTAVKIALAKRREVLFAYTRKSNLSKTKMGQYDKLQEVGAASDAKAINLESEIKTLKEESSVLWDDVETISKRLSRDLERFKVEFAEKMRSTFENFHSIQKEYADKHSEGWAELLPILKPRETKEAETLTPTPKSDEAITTSV